MRVAIYFTPSADAEATRLAALWLNRDAFADTPTRPADPTVDPLVSEPARYGFHATMKAPFRLGEGSSIADLEDTLAAFCDERSVAWIETLVLRRIDGFLALVPEHQSNELSSLADAVVRRFEPFRAPLDAGEIARRRPDRLTERQRAYLAEWGYPFVFDEFRFHMTLTGRLDTATATAIEADIARRFAAILDRPLAVDGLALFVEPEPGAPFHLRVRHSFGVS